MNSLVKLLRYTLGLSAVATLLLLIPGCRTPDGTGRPGHAGPTSPYIDGRLASNSDGPIEGSSDWLRPGDVVIINFSGVSTPPARVDDRIREDGKIVLPFVGLIDAAGITRSELQTRIRDAYVPKYYKQLTVSVNPDTRFIYVDGEVKRPGNYTYSGEMTVSKAIAAAGGFTDFANRKKIQLRRGKEKPIIINWEKAMQNPAKLDLPVFPEDLIYVRRRWF